MSEILEEIFERGRARGEAESAKKLSRQKAKSDARISQMAADMERLMAENAALKKAARL